MHCHLVGIPHSNGHVYYSNGKIIIQKCHKCTSCFSKFKILEHNIWQELEIYPNGRWIFNHQLHQFVHHSSICSTESCRSLPSCQQVFFVVRNIPQSTDLMSSLNEAVNSFDLIRGQRRKIVASQLRFPCKQTQRKKKKTLFHTALILTLPRGAACENAVWISWTGHWTDLPTYPASSRVGMLMTLHSTIIAFTHPN